MVTSSLLPEGTPLTASIYFNALVSHEPGPGIMISDAHIVPSGDFRDLFPAAPPPQPQPPQPAPWSVHRVSNGLTLHLIDQPAALLPACAAIAAAAAAAPRTLAIDLEGVSLSRHGELCIVQVATGRRAPVWAFDICALGGAAAFAPGAPGAPTLRSLLEDPALRKLFWDCRADCNALAFLHGVRPQGVLDLQLLEVAHRLARSGGGAPPPTAVTGLAALLERAPRLAALTPLERRRVGRVKAAALALFSPAAGGSYAVWRERPLRPVLREYCTDAALFFSLEAGLGGGALAGAGARAALAAATQRRLALSFTEAFDQVRTSRALAVGVDSALLAELRALGLGGGGGGGAQGSSEAEEGGEEEEEPPAAPAEEEEEEEEVEEKGREQLHED